MSDNIEVLLRQYKEDVLSRNPRSIGLFPIPEYPELEEERGMWSAALDVLLTTLRYLAPATLLTLFWGQQSFFFTLIRHIDHAFRAIVFSSEEQKKEVLQWLAEAGPMTVEHLDTVWRHGWILCSILDGALPGACAGHPPIRLSLQHAQTIADHYLGVEPVFSRHELESNDSLSRHQEWKLATYLNRIRQALSKLTPAVSKPPSQRTSPETTQFTFDYVAKGSGLTVAQIKHKMSFKIYPTSQQALDPGEVTILIKGPKDTYGMTVLPPILGKAQKIRQKLLGLQAKQTYTENILPITQGATYLRAYGKNDMNKTYFIPKTKYDIDIDVDRRLDHAKIVYTVKREGKYEISITSRGQSIVGSPFTITATHNIIRVLERDNFCLENGEEIDIVDVKSDRKVVLRIVDFVTEKMLLRENGTLEKISDVEAKLLMATDVENERSCSVTEIDDHFKTRKFSDVAQKILKMNRICKVFNENLQRKPAQSSQKTKDNDSQITNRTQNDIPDIVNSTLYDTGINPFIVAEDKYIVPESISVSIRTEKAKPLSQNINEPKRTEQILNRTTSPDSLEDKLSEDDYEDNESVDRLTPLRTKNPFLLENNEDFTVEKKMGTFVKSEYEANNSQSEETPETMIKIIVDDNNSPISDSIIETNPFVSPPDVRLLDRPKTPVYKIITGELSDRTDSPYLDPKMETLSDDQFSNEFINPFFMHQLQSSSHYEKQPVTDFIIGAPVSLPQSVRVQGTEPKDNNIEVLNTDSKPASQEQIKPTEDDISASVFSTPLHTKIEKPNDNLILLSSTFHSLDSDLTDTIDTSNASTTSETQFDVNRIDSSQRIREISPRKDLWDSAYVSIDESTSSPDGNNNESHLITEAYNKQNFSHSEENYDLREEDFRNMGPAERELWTTCAVLNENNQIQEDIKPYRWDIKRPIFTPILEESDRSISSGVKDMSLKSIETDSVTVAFAELNDIYQEYFPTSEKRLSITSENSLEKSEVGGTMETDDMGVESASEASDVTGHKMGKEGKISEVQVNATESVSVSHTLQNQDNVKPNLNETQFGDDTYSNIVTEKKKYWDERIRQIEAKTEESTKHLKKKRVPAKQLKHDSLSKRKGKQIIKNYLNAEAQQAKLTRQNSLNKSSTNQTLLVSETQLRAEANLVDKWKRFWDEKLESEESRAASRNSNPNSPNNLTAYDIEQKSYDQSPEVKQTVEVKEIPEEEVFKAFETSPKRFFGTSRKCIMNKIDTYLSKPNNTLEDTVIEPKIASPDSGLVSSRISLFHSMSNTEPLSGAKRSLSSHNIIMREDNELRNNMNENIEVKEISQTNIKETEKETVTGEPITVDKNENSKNIKDKRARMRQNTFNISFDESTNNKTSKELPESKKTSAEIKYNTEKTIYKETCKKLPVSLRKSSMSKSEMDIFNKVPVEIDDGLNKHKSYEELPKINVKSFISLYENVSKTSIDPRPTKKLTLAGTYTSQNISMNKDAEKKSPTIYRKAPKSLSLSVAPDTNTTDTIQRSETISTETTSVESLDEKSECEVFDKKDSNKKQTTYISLSDMELEIVESSPEKSSESSPERVGLPHIEYKNRFKEAKQYFQSLEELRELKKPKKLNECQLLLLNQSTESLENESNTTEKKPQKRVRKMKVKSHSMPSSELAKYWNEMQEKEKQKETKLIKISEKFHVDDLFSDVMEGKLSRQGSLRGIPHKKAVLEAFRSMENVSDDKISPYDISTSQNTEFTIENRVTSAQTYLNEYPYLPTTDPSKSHSRLDAKASGLITLKELLEKKQRRNSVPDLRMLAPKFSADL